jgi:hypothetical protein
MSYIAEKSDSLKEPSVPCPYILPNTCQTNYRGEDFMSSKALIVKVKRDSGGNISHVMLSDGSIHSIREALDMSRDGLVENIVVKQGEGGRKYYRDHPTSLGLDNFDHIPEF